MNLEQEFALGRITFYPATVGKDGQRKKAPETRLYLSSDDGKGLEKLLKFVAAPETAETLKVSIDTGLLDEDDKKVTWSGLGQLGRTTVKPPTGMRAKEEGSKLITTHFLTFPEHGENDLVDLLHIRVLMSEQDLFVAKVKMQPTQDNLFPSTAPEPETAGAA